MDVTETSIKPDPLHIEGNTYNNWITFKREFRDYLISIEFDGKPSKVKAAKLRNLIGDGGRQKILALGLENSFDYDFIIQKLDMWAESQKCSTYERLEFYNRVQIEGESFESFLSDVKRLILLCNFGDLSDELLRDKVVTGILSQKLKTLFRANPNVSLEIAVQMCRMSDLSEAQLLQLLSWRKGENKSNVVVNGSSETAVEDAVSDNAAQKNVSEQIKNGCVRGVSSLSNTTNESNLDKACSEGTFSFTVENFTEFRESRLSPPWFIRNLPWQIKVTQRQRSEENKLYLGFFLQCNNECKSTTWSCNASAQLKILPQNAGKPLVRKIQHLFTSKEYDWGFSYFVPWNDLLDPEKGYIKDNSITFEVHVIAEVPSS